VIDVGPELDAARARVVERGLVREAFAQLTPVVVGQGLSVEALGPVKQLQKRFFSEVPWTGADDEALADAIGPGDDGTERYELEPGLTLSWGWEGGRFRLRVAGDPPVEVSSHGGATVDLGATFDGVVVPEATPSPRTIRFATPPLHHGASRAYASAAAASDDPPVARLFHAFDAVTDVLVGPDFVAVTIARPDRWESLLEPMLRTVTEEFAGDRRTEPGETTAPPSPVGQASTDTRAETGRATDGRPRRRLEIAWADLGALRADQADDLDRVLAAARAEEPARRQVAAVLLAGAPPDVASAAWARLLDDPSRTVRRSAIDTVVDADRETLRPLLERALDDSDPWVRWKALRGIARLGADASRAAVEAHAADPDFRVRLEAARLFSNDPTHR
jgi:HEAT repeats/Scaffold protein Nfu/NifU N terminal